MLPYNTRNALGYPNATNGDRSKDSKNVELFYVYYASQALVETPYKEKF
jgi:hypothetical protein